MHSSGSILRTFTERIRQLIDDPDLDAKYDNNYLIRHLLSPSMMDVIARVGMMSDEPILLRFGINIRKGVQYYQLPPSVRQIWRVAVIDVNGAITEEVLPRGEFDPRGPGWSIEGNVLSFRLIPQTDRTFDVWFVPSGQILCHLSTNGTLDADEITFNLGSTIPLGGIDQRPNAYVGMYLRTIEPGNAHEERIISAYDQQAGTVTVRIPFQFQGSLASTSSSSSTSSGELLDYEIVPFLLESMLEAISCRAAMKVGTGRKISQAHQQSIMIEYRSSIKTAHDNLSNLKARFGKFFDTATVDSDHHPRTMPLSLIDLK